VAYPIANLGVELGIWANILTKTCRGCAGGIATAIYCWPVMNALTRKNAVPIGWPPNSAN
jgi:hypothetical protein